jgi:hypothetical protein
MVWCKMIYSEMCVACWSIVFPLSLFLVSDAPLVNTTNLLILLPWYDCRCCCPLHGILRGQLLFKIWTETAVVGVARIPSCPWFHLWLSLCISILASPKRVTEKKKIQENFKFYSRRCHSLALFWSILLQVCFLGDNVAVFVHFWSIQMHNWNTMVISRS